MTPRNKLLFINSLVLTVIELISASVISDEYLFPNIPIGAPDSEDNLCSRESRIFLQHLSNSTLWANQMYDASAKSSVGVLQGNAFQLGHFDECFKVEGPFKTQYCLVTMRIDVPIQENFRDPLSLYYSPFGSVLAKLQKTQDESQQSRDYLHVAECLPASCTSGYLKNYLNKYLAALEKPFGDSNVTYSADVDEGFCQSEDDERNFDSYGIGFCILVTILLMSVILSTVYDCQGQDENEKKSHHQSTSQKLLTAFSLKRNFLELPKIDASNPALNIFYGTKTIAIFMIIIDHRFGSTLGGALQNFDFLEEEYRSWKAWFFFHGDLFVDTFFVLSGALVCYGLLVQFDKKIVNPGFIVLLRYIRLTPVYAFIIFYYTSIYYHTGSGPLWKQVIGPEVEDCRNNWWTNLLYISNYVNDDHMCMVHSWYLPCDFHYFIIGIFLVLLIKKRKKIGLALTMLSLIASLIIPFVITVVYLRPALLRFFPSFLVAPKTHTDYRMTYSKSHTRAVPYFVGMFAGYIYYKIKDSNEHLSRLTSHCITVVCAFLLVASMSIGAIFYDPYHTYDAVESGLYASLHRLTWALGTVGLLFTASHGSATYLRAVLSWTPFVSLSKLVYAAYLIHFSFDLRSVASARSPFYLSYLNLFCLGLGDVVFSFGLSLILYLVVEIPVRKIFKELLLPTRRPPVDVQNSETTSVNRYSVDSKL